MIRKILAVAALIVVSWGSAPGAASAQSVDAKAFLNQFLADTNAGEAASVDPALQEAFINCLGEQSSGALSGYSTFDPNQWSSLEGQTFDLSGIARDAQQAVARCQAEINRLTPTN